MTSDTGSFFPNWRIYDITKTSLRKLAKYIAIFHSGILGLPQCTVLCIFVILNFFTNIFNDTIAHLETRHCQLYFTTIYPWFFVGDLIYIIGGASTQSNRILRSVECFDTATGTWISGVQDLPYPSKWIRCLSVAFADSK